MSLTTTVNEKGLEAAKEVYRYDGLKHASERPIDERALEAAIEAYLRTASKDAEPVGYTTKKALSDVAAGLIGNHVFPAGTLHPEDEVALFTHPSTGGEGGVRAKRLDDDQIMEAHEHAATVASGGVQGGTIEAFVAYKDMRSYDHVELMERVLGNRLQSVEEVRNHSGYLTGWNIVLASPEPSLASGPIIKPQIIQDLREWAEFEQDGGNVEQGVAIDIILDWYDRQIGFDTSRAHALSSKQRSEKE